MQIYSRIDEIPAGTAPDTVTPGCLVLEGGAWRGIYTQGAVDALMEAGLLFETTIGVSAGALAAIGYESGQIGWAPRINLSHRHDSDYCGRGAYRRDHGITGFSYLFHDLTRLFPMDTDRFNDPKRRLVAVATNVNTGRPVYFEKGKCEDMLKAIQASATVPYISRPVIIDDQPYLDGGCSVHIPYDWALEQGFKKIVVIRTRDRSFRRDDSRKNHIDGIMYRRHPEFLQASRQAAQAYNGLLDRLDADELDGRIFQLCPKDPVNISRFEGDVEKLGDLYWRGYNEMKEAIPALHAYLNH